MGRRKEPVELPALLQPTGADGFADGSDIEWDARSREFAICFKHRADIPKPRAYSGHSRRDTTRDRVSPGNRSGWHWLVGGEVFRQWCWVAKRDDGSAACVRPTL